jgi:protein phosphatase PTC7
MRALTLRRRLCTSAVPRLRFEFGARCVPHPSKEEKGGEDAYFACAATGAFGVSDGVGGSADEYTDPGIFSRALLRHCHSYAMSESLRARLEHQSDAERWEARLPDAVRFAAKEFEADPVDGSATLVLGALTPGGTLQLLSVGDSQALLLRPRPREFRAEGGRRQLLWPRTVLSTHEATHYFNCPYQVTRETLIGALESEADEVSARVALGDVVVAATDGVTDNLHGDQLQSLVAGKLQKLWSPDADERAAGLDELAAAIAAEAVRVGHLQDDPKVTTPFSMAAAREGLRSPGGKLDDVAVVTAVVWGDEAARSGPLLSNF